MRNLVSTLSAGEMKVYEVLLTGATNQEIANELSIALQTVKFHLANIYGKLGVANRSGAVAYGMGNGEIDAPSITGGGAFTEAQIRAAAALLVERGIGDRKVVNSLVLDLLAALGGKL